MSKEWQYHAARGFGKILCHLPYPVIISLGRKLGPFVGKLMKKQRERGIFQIQRGMECSREEAERIMNDVELIANAGFGAAPLDACEEARRSAAFVSAYPGGHGALREFAEYILKSQHVWDKVLRQYFGDATFTLRQ